MLEIALLGQFDVVYAGEKLAIATRNAQALFAYLVLSSGRAQRRERLAGLLWPDSLEATARSNLRHELWRLRKAFEPLRDEVLLVDQLSIAFNTNIEHAVDVDLFEAVPVEGSTSSELERSLDLHRGELLPGFHYEWVYAERQRIQGLYEARMARLLELLLAEGRWDEAVNWSLRWIAGGALPEPAYRALMLAYANSGDVPRAAETYERFKQALYSELGVQPSEATQVLYGRLKQGWNPSLPDTAVSSLPPVAAAPAGTAVPIAPAWQRCSNIPRPLTNFIGRDQEIRQVEQLVSMGRLVTIAGPGGVGKTRLAIQVATELATTMLDGACWVELAALPAYSALSHSGGKEHRLLPGVLSSHERVIMEIANALHVAESPGVAPVDRVVERLCSERILLVLDNCEHVIESCAAVSERLLYDCAELRILVTSREPLHLPGEMAWYLPSLSCPVPGMVLDQEAIVQSEAVRLFVERANDALPGYTPSPVQAQEILQICQRLDGIPLAIELAAARMNMMLPQEILSRLDDRFALLTAGGRTALPRHQTLQAAIDWSYELLSEQEQALFRRLSVFAGSFTLAAAEAVCADDQIPTTEVLDLLGRLLNKSLVTLAPRQQASDIATRYLLLDTICSFARRKLDEAEEKGVTEARFAEYFTQYVEAAEPELIRPNQRLWYRRLLVESDNIRAVVDQSACNNDAERALRLVGAYVWFWWAKGSIRSGLDLARRALALPFQKEQQGIRAKALNTGAFLSWFLGDVTTARQYVEEAVAIQSDLGDQAGLMEALQFLGLVLNLEGHYTQADAMLRDVVAGAQKLGDLNRIGFSLAFRGDIALLQGDFTRAERVHEESANTLHALGNKIFEAYPLRRLGFLALERGDFERAQRCFWDSLTINYECDDQRAVAACLAAFAALAALQGRPAAAARLVGKVDSMLSMLSTELLTLDQSQLDNVRGQLQKNLDEETYHAALVQGWQLSTEEAIQLVAETFPR